MYFVHFVLKGNFAYFCPCNNRLTSGLVSMLQYLNVSLDEKKLQCATKFGVSFGSLDVTLI